MVHYCGSLIGLPRIGLPEAKRSNLLTGPAPAVVIRRLKLLLKNRTTTVEILTVIYDSTGSHTASADVPRWL